MESDTNNERPSDPCLKALEEEPVKRLDSEKAVDKFVSRTKIELF